MNMLVIMDGSLEKIKGEITSASKQVVSNIKATRSLIRAWTKVEKKAAKEEKRGENKPPKEFDQKLMQLEGLLKIYQSKMVPVKVGDILIDFASYQKAMKKLEGFNIDINLADRELIMRYRSGTGKTKGSIFLKDLSPYFKDFQSIPVAVIGGIDYGKEA